MIDTLRLTAEEASLLLERGEIAPRELFDAYSGAIDERDADVHAFLTRVSEPQGSGVPIALKDVITTKGIRTTAGSLILENYVPVFDSTVAARCKEAGMPVLGKTNTDEFAMGSSTENSAYGPTHNPWDLTRVPGGSGGGSAAAVAAGLAPWALGSDTGGSIKLPAAFCGNVGLRPTYGTVSRFGVVAFASSLDQVGPVTRNVRDNALLYGIISGRDVNDSTTVEVPPVELPTADQLRGMKIGVPRQLNEPDGIEPGVRAAVAAAIALAESLGADVELCELPLSVDYGLACYYLITPAEASANLARYDGVRYGLRGDGADFGEMVRRTRHDGFGDEVKRRIMLGTYALSAGYYDAYYRTAQQVRTVIKREHDALFERFDVLVSPTCATTAFPLGAKAQDPLAMYLTDVLTIPSNMAGLPSLSLPCGLSEGLPVGLQLIGPQFSENTLFRVAYALEQGLEFEPRPGEAPVSWQPVIGLEIHIQLKTDTKMFCRCANAFGARPNTQTCPVCLALPGALPVPNRRAIEQTIKLGLALGCEIAERAVFHRKNYFYPDLPKAYQISQYDEPLCTGGRLVVPTAEGNVEVAIVRAHLEEDAAKNVHVAASGRIQGATATLVDFNRGGTPLLEIVTAPVIHSSEHAKRFLQLLRQTVVELGLSDAELEKGSMRFDVNVSVRPEGSDELRTRTELKNMNSFNFAAKGIERELARQIAIYEAGGTVEQETLHFDPGDESSPPLRSKEGSEDYRYFPEPDLVPVAPEPTLVAALREELLELPGERIERITTLLSFSEADVLVTSGLDRLWSAALEAGADPKQTANVLANAFLATGLDPGNVDPVQLARLVGARAEIPRAAFTDALEHLADESFDVAPYLELRTVSDAGALDPVIEGVIAAHPAQLASYRAGKESLIGFFVGQVMARTGGKADPKIVNERLRVRLGG